MSVAGRPNREMHCCSLYGVAAVIERRKDNSRWHEAGCRYLQLWTKQWAREADFDLLAHSTGSQKKRQNRSMAGCTVVGKKGCKGKGREGKDLRHQNCPQPQAK